MIAGTTGAPRYRLAAVVPAAALVLAAPHAGGAPAAETLTVFAAASLTDAFQELGQTLERGRPGLRVRFNFAGSQQLAAQLEQGAAADVFASADQRWMKHVEERGLASGKAELFARNRLVVVVPEANPARVERLEDLARRGIKVVLASEAVPAGKYSREALRNLERAPGFVRGYVRATLGNVVSEEENVKGVLAKIQLGEADAGMVYRSDVTPSVARRVRVLEIPDEYNVAASYPIAVLEGARNPDTARAFVRLVLGAEGQRVLRRHGLLPAATGREAGATASP